LLDRVRYLNAGMLGPLTRHARDAVAGECALDAERRDDPELWTRLVAHQAAARGAVTSLTGVSVDQVALTHTTHEALNVCLWGLPLDADGGHSIVTTDEEHPGLLVPLRHVRDRRACEIRTAAWVDDDETFVANVLALVDTGTRAVALSHVSWVTGRVAPISALGAALPDGVRLIVDGAQSAGVLAVDPSDGWDAYTVSGQKWSCGPNGSGGLALVDPEAWLPTFGAYLQLTDPSDPFGSALTPTAARFESSQEASGPLAGFAASVAWLVGEVGLWRAHEHALALNSYARSVLASGPRTAALTLHGHEHLLCIDVAEGTALTVVQRIARAGVSVRPLGASRLRLSLGAWNSTEDIDACVAALADEL